MYTPPPFLTAISHTHHLVKAGRPQQKL